MYNAGEYGCGMNDPRSCQHCSRPFSRGKTEGVARYASRQFCSVACGSRARFKTADEIFDLMVIKAPDPCGCWGWKGHTIKGYPNIVVQSRGTRANRHSYARFNGTIPPGMFVCHRCDNPECTNPAHLFLGTPGDNSRDMVVKRRQAFGENAPRAKLTADQAREILGSPDDSRVLAARYGVSRSTIYAVRSGDNWASLRK